MNKEEKELIEQAELIKKEAELLIQLSLPKKEIKNAE